MERSLDNLLIEVKEYEKKVSGETDNIIEESYRITTYLRELLNSVKQKIVVEGFKDDTEEINFFKNIKPQILGKLIYYNKVFRIETSCPVNNGKMYHTFFSNELEDLKQEYNDHICNSDFYRYYRARRTDRDTEYFKLGKINYHNGLNSFVFEIDTSFSTYYDYKIARIIANELLYAYLLAKTHTDHKTEFMLQSPESTKEIFWTGSKNALIELIYALHASGVISHGKIGIRKISLAFHILFRIPLGDIHHAFHRMKDRAGSRTTFLDQLKLAMEEYMDKDLA
ncbi:RteC domain-containing protein [Flavobacterium faecale]|uniref:RteC domain-containing protein n=1 Tax=Flavobacterium faecale TaxID=1355330 RepID=UPI003AADC458